MHRDVKEQFQIFCGSEISPDDWLWCTRCHRSYKACEFRKLNAKGKVFLLCHYYNDCTGDLPINSRSWRKLTENNPALPKTPQKGEVYEK